MKKKVIIFGINDFAELANFYLGSDSNYEVSGFSVTKEYMPENNLFKELPVVDFEFIEHLFNPNDYYFFAPLAASKMKKFREKIYYSIKAKGYQMISYISNKATVLTKDIGENCFILEDNTIQPFVKIGDNVVIWSGNHIGHHTFLKNHVTITSHVVISGHCEIGNNCFLGVNSTISNGVKLADGTLVSLASVIEKNTSAWSVYKGNPAEKLSIPSYRVKL